MKDLIEQLKNNGKAFNCMAEALRDFLLEKVGGGDAPEPADFQIMTRGGEWEPQGGNYFYGEKTYRLRPDYTEPAEDEYELCEIKDTGGKLQFYYYNGGWKDLDVAIHYPNFAGCLYEDGEMRPTSVRYFQADGLELFDNMPLKRLQSGDITIKRPYPNGSVVLKK